MSKALRSSFLLMVFIIPVLIVATEKLLSIKYPSNIHVEVISKSHPGDTKFFKNALEDKLGKDESSEQYSKPGFPIIVGSEDGDYLLKVEIRDRTESTTPGENDIVHMAVNASLWLRNVGDSKVWSREFVCNGPEVHNAIQQCVDIISNELKSAQVKKGKRAGKLGWEKKVDNGR
jgi:hypothetical protein